MFGAISIQKTVSKILTGFLRTTSGLTPKFSKYNDPEKTDITKPEHEYYCSYDEDYKNVKKFGLSDFVIHDIKWKSEDDHVKYSIRVNSISEQVSSELEAIFNQKYKEKWCDALKGVREATEEGQNQKYFNDLRTISKGVYNAAN